MVRKNPHSLKRDVWELYIIYHVVNLILTLLSYCTVNNKQEMNTSYFYPGPTALTRVIQNILVTKHILYWHSWVEVTD